VLDEFYAFRVVERELGVVFVHQFHAIHAEVLDGWDAGGQCILATAVGAEGVGHREDVVLLGRRVVRIHGDAALLKHRFVIEGGAGVEVPGEPVGAFLKVGSLECGGVPGSWKEVIFGFRHGIGEIEQDARTGQRICRFRAHIDHVRQFSRSGVGGQFVLVVVGWLVDPLDRDTGVLLLELVDQSLEVVGELLVLQIPCLELQFGGAVARAGSASGESAHKGNGRAQCDRLLECASFDIFGLFFETYGGNAVIADRFMLSAHGEAEFRWRTHRFDCYVD
jgi:hypothetical protein